MLPHFAVGLICVGSIVVAGALIAVVALEFAEAWEETRRTEEDPRSRSSAVLVPGAAAGLRRRRGQREDGADDGGALSGEKQIVREKRSPLEDEDPFRLDSCSDSDRARLPFPDAPPPRPPRAPLSRASSTSSVSSSIAPLFSPPPLEDWDLINRQAASRSRASDEHIHDGWSAVGSDSDEWDRISAASDDERSSTVGRRPSLVGAGSLREY